MVQVLRATPVVQVQVVQEVLEKLRLPETPVAESKLADRPAQQVLREGVQVIRVAPVVLVLRHPQFL